MHRVDVHTIHMPRENLAWAEQSANSLLIEPVNVFHVDGFEGDIRRGRYHGFRQGTAEYVSFVDPDDYVEPGAFQQCVEALDANPQVCGVYTLSNIIHNDRNHGLNHPYRVFGSFTRPEFLEIHQLTVMRRDILMDWYIHDYNDIPAAIAGMQWVYWSMAQTKPWLALNFVGYNWRHHDSCSHANPSSAHINEVQRTMAHINNVWRTHYAAQNRRPHSAHT